MSLSNDLDFLLYGANPPIPISTIYLKLLGGECYIEFHLTLPKPYENKPRFVYWCGVDTGQLLYGKNGTGDDQIWLIEPKSKKAIPLQNLTMFSDVIWD